jgi:hypothetical protein
MKASAINTIFILSLLNNCNAKSIPFGKHINPHLQRERRRFLKLIKININPQDFDPRRLGRRQSGSRVDDEVPMIAGGGKGQMYLRCSAIVFTW